MNMHELALQGKSTLCHSLASGIASRIFEIRKNNIKESFMNFQGEEHRMEYVTNVHGIEFINDSIIDINIAQPKVIWKELK